MEARNKNPVVDEDDARDGTQARKELPLLGREGGLEMKKKPVEPPCLSDVFYTYKEELARQRVTSAEWRAMLSWIGR
jgi:hypothetical protein